MLVGKIVRWNTDSNMHKSQQKVSNKKPDFLLVLGKSGKSDYRAVPCWAKNPRYTMCILSSPHNLFVDARKIINVKPENLIVCDDYVLKDVSDTIRKVKEKHIIIREQKRLRKIEKNQQKKKAEIKKAQQKEQRKIRREKVESTYGRTYDLAAINNDRRTMKKIEKKVGHDPRPAQRGLKSGSKLNSVTNPKPCVGGRVSPK